MMQAYDPNACEDVCRLFLSCREAAGEKAELKGLIAVAVVRPLSICRRLARRIRHR